MQGVAANAQKGLGGVKAALPSREALLAGAGSGGAGSGALGEARGFKRGKRDPHAAVQRI